MIRLLLRACLSVTVLLLLLVTVARVVGGMFPGDQLVLAIAERFEDELWLLDARTKLSVRLTDNDDQEFLLAWSVDGRQIAFFSDRRAADGSTSSADNLFSLKLSGLQISAQPEGVNWHLTSAPVYREWIDAGGELIRLPAGAYLDVERRVLREYRPITDGFAVIESDLADTDTERIIARWEGHYVPVGAPLFSSDGNRLLMIASQPPDHTLRLFVFDVTSGARRELYVSEASVLSGAVWSQDGRFIALIERRGPRQTVIIVNAENHHAPESLLSLNEPIINDLSWSASGRWLALRYDVEQHSQLCVMNTDTGMLTCLLPWSSPLWRPLPTTD